MNLDIERLQLQLDEFSVSPIIPTKTSDLINDSGFVEDTHYVHTDHNFTNALYNMLSSPKTIKALKWFTGEEDNILQQLKNLIDNIKSNKQDKPEISILGNIAVWSEDSNTVDGGVSLSNIQQIIRLNDDITWDYLINLLLVDKVIKSNEPYAFTTSTLQGVFCYEENVKGFTFISITSGTIQIRFITEIEDTNWKGLQKELELDTVPTQGSNKFLTSGSIYDAIELSIERAKEDINLSITNYDNLTNLPTINGVQLSGNIKATELNLLSSNAEDYDNCDMENLTDEDYILNVDKNGKVSKIPTLQISKKSNKITTVTNIDPNMTTGDYVYLLKE